jgi:hypothetical protein
MCPPPSRPWWAHLVAHFEVTRITITHDVAPDGRFVMIEREPNDNSTSASIVVVLNWSEELKARVPTK